MIPCPGTVFFKFRKGILLQYLGSLRSQGKSRSVLPTVPEQRATEGVISNIINIINTGQIVGMRRTY